MKDSSTCPNSSNILSSRRSTGGALTAIPPINKRDGNSQHKHFEKDGKIDPDKIRFIDVLHMKPHQLPAFVEANKRL